MAGCEEDRFRSRPLIMPCIGDSPPCRLVALMYLLHTEVAAKSKEAAKSVYRGASAGTGELLEHVQLTEPNTRFLACDVTVEGIFAMLEGTLPGSCQRVSLLFAATSI